MSKSDQYSLIVYGEYKDVEEAKNALQTPFIEDYVEEHGRFRMQDFSNIRVAKGISLGELEIGQIDIETFEIACSNSQKPLNRKRIEELSTIIDVYDMFDEIEIKAQD